GRRVPRQAPPAPRLRALQLDLGREPGRGALGSDQEEPMPTYLMLTNLTAEGLRTLKNNPTRVTEVNQEVEQMGGRVVAQYATLGDYDFVTVIEAPDERTMAKISVELGSRGTMTSRTLTAMPAADLSD